MKSVSFVLCLATVVCAAPALSKSVDLVIAPARPAGNVAGISLLVPPYGELHIDADFGDDDDLQCQEMTTTTYKPNGDLIIITRHACD